jgi:maltooligosyltrehalose trehalohydrolase
MAGRWSDDLHHGLHAVLTGERADYFVDYASVGAVARALDQVHHLDGRWSHSRQRGHGAPVGDTPRHRFVVAAQNHDQIGNRAGGERLVHLVGTGAAKLAAGVVLLGPYTPLLFQGQEWAASSRFRFFADFQDATLREAVIEGRSKEFAELGDHRDELADPFALETFEQCRLRWDELDDEPHAEMLDWYRRLLALRRQEPELSDPRPRATLVERDGDLVVMRRGSITVLANFGDRTHRCQLDELTEPEIVLASDDATIVDDSQILLAPRSLAVVRAPVVGSGHAAR